MWRTLFGVLMAFILLICCVSQQSCGSRTQFSFVTRHWSLLAPFGVDQPLGKNVKLLQSIKTFVGCLSCQVPNSPDVLFYKRPWPKSVAPENALSMLCAEQPGAAGSTWLSKQRDLFCLRCSQEKNHFKTNLFWVMQCCYVWNRGRKFWHPVKPLHTEGKTSAQAAGVQ